MKLKDRTALRMKTQEIRLSRKIDKYSFINICKLSS